MSPTPDIFSYLRGIIRGGKWIPRFEDRLYLNRLQGKPDNRGDLDTLVNVIAQRSR
jgi:hypothetical protein